MNGSNEEMDEGKYMIRRKFYIPEREVSRDYRRFDSHPSNFLFDCDYEEEKNDEDKVYGSESESE